METSNWIASVSAVIALVSLGYTVFFARTQHKLNQMLVAEKEREQAERKVVSLCAELIKRSPQDWILRTTNVGQGTAYAITVGLESLHRYPRTCVANCQRRSGMLAAGDLNKASRPATR